MVLTLKKIQHRGAGRIGIFFPYSFEVKEKLKSFGAVYSSTLRCWYVDYTKEKYHLLKKNFDKLVIENPKPGTAKTIQVAGAESRDLPPIVSPKNLSGKPEVGATKLPEKANEKPIRGHKAEQVPLAQKLRLLLHDNIGKYWVFSMHYHSRYIQQLLEHASIKTTMIYIHISSKAVARIQSPLDRLTINTDTIKKNKNDKKV